MKNEKYENNENKNVNKDDNDIEMIMWIIKKYDNVID